MLVVASCGAGLTPSPTPTPTPTPTPPASSGIRVTTVAGPTCPVQHAGEVCTAPISVQVMIERADGSVVASTHTSVAGVASVAVAPGQYLVVGGPAGSPGQGFPRAPGGVTVTVQSGAYAKAELNYDTGLR